MNTKQKALAKKILMGLERQSFADFYNSGMFDDYVTGAYPEGHPKRPTEEQVLEQIVRLFKL